MKADERLQAIPVIMQTAATSPEQIREGLAAGPLLPDQALRGRGPC